MVPEEIDPIFTDSVYFSLANLSLKHFFVADDQERYSGTAQGDLSSFAFAKSRYFISDVIEGGPHIMDRVASGAGEVSARKDILSPATIVNLLRTARIFLYPSGIRLAFDKRLSSTVKLLDVVAGPIEFEKSAI
jgi:hypothetical protein